MRQDFDIFGEPAGQNFKAQRVKIAQYTDGPLEFQGHELYIMLLQEIYLERIRKYKMITCQNGML